MTRCAMTWSAALCVLLTLLAGCQAVGSSVPPGSPEVELSRTLGGAWLLGQSVVHVQPMGDGRLSVAAPKWEDDRWQMEVFTFHVTQAGDAYYLSRHVSADAEQDQPEAYVFMRMIPALDGGAGVVTLFSPDREVFAKAVADGRLKGRVTADAQGKEIKSVFLTDTAQALGAFLQLGQAGVQFDLNQPLVLQRVARHPGQ